MTVRDVIGGQGRQNDYYRPALLTTQGTMQGGLVLPTLFNIVVDNFIQTWLAMTLEDQGVTHNGMGEAARHCLGIFHIDDDIVGSRDSWIQHLMNVLIVLFRHYGLTDNIAKSRTMTCQPGA